MRSSNKCKLLSVIILVLFSILLTSCGFVGFGRGMPMSEIESGFENDDWLLINNILINKPDNKVFRLKPDTDASIEGIAGIFYHGPYAYKVDFEETEFKLYTFLRTYYYPEGSSESEHAYFDCVFTYDYEGHELDRMYLSEALTEEQTLSLYNTRFSKAYRFIIDVDSSWQFDKKRIKVTDEAEQAILDHAESIYNTSATHINTVAGIARTINDEVWFSLVIAPKGDFSVGDPIMSDICSSAIKSYDPDTKEIKVVFEYNKENETIIDFDENGLYAFDSRGNIKYVDMKTKESTSVFKVDGSIHTFEITDDHICTSYRVGNNEYCYIVYEKGKEIVADSQYS